VRSIDDIGSPPLGVERPDHVSRISTVYRRDDAVRQFVLRQANGKCEYCGALAFELPNGNGYLEAYHIINIAKQDRIKWEM